MRHGDPVFLAVELAELLDERDVALVRRPGLDRAEVRREVHIDAGLLELGDLIIHPLQPRRVVLGGAVLRLDAAPAGTVGELVETDRVDAELRIERRPFVGERLLGAQVP